MSLLPLLQIPPLGLWNDYPMGCLHVVAERRCYHCRTALFANHPNFLPLLECAPLPHLSLLIHNYPQFTPYELRSTHHSLSLTKVRLYPHSIKHYFHSRQCCLDPYGVADRYAAMNRIENYVVLSCRQYQPMLRLLRNTDLQKKQPCQCVHHNVEDCCGDQAPLGHSSLRSERSSIEPSCLWNHHLLTPQKL